MPAGGAATRLPRGFDAARLSVAAPGVTSPGIVSVSDRQATAGPGGIGPVSRRSWRRAMSVRGYLFLLAVAMLLPLLTLAGLLTARVAEAERARASLAVAATAEGVLTAIDREVVGLIETLQTLESSPSLTAGEIGIFQAQITELARVFGLTIVLRDPGGRLLAGSTMLATSPQAGAITPSRNDERLLGERGVVVSGVYRAPLSGNAVFAVMMPVQRDGEVRYLLHIAPPATRLHALLAAQRLPPEVRVTVIDTDGLVLTRSQAHEETVGQATQLREAILTASQERSRAGRGIDREGRLVQFDARRAQHGWTVVTSIPAEQIDGPRRRALAQAAIAGVLLTGAALIAARMIGTRLARAIGGLAVTASALDRGEIRARERSGIREIDEVATTLDLAGQRLRAAAEQRAQAEERKRLILHELNHRVKNTLAMVQALAALAARGAPDVATYRDRLTERLNGLARTQALLTESDWTGADLDDLLHAELGPYDEPPRGVTGEAATIRRVSLEGPSLRLPAHRVVAFGMLLHELATNAAKYGALSLPQGRLRVAWTVQDQGLALEWTETGGPPVVQPARQGFGTQMINRGLARQLGAEVATDWRPEGVRFTLRMPLAGDAPPAA